MTDTTKKILIVEDELTLLKTLQETFADEGFQVMTAADGEIGLKLALEEHPDAILLDIIMPKKDGMTLMRELREGDAWGKRVPIVLLTNLNADDGIIRNITRDEPAYYLVKKDWKLDDVVARTKSVLETTPASP